MRDYYTDYIPDLTERYPEGFRSYSYYDEECEAWDALEKEYWENVEKEYWENGR